MIEEQKNVYRKKICTHHIYESDGTLGLCKTFFRKNFE